MKNILNRIKLLMEYDTSKTMSENILMIENVSTADDLLRGLNILKNAGIADDVFVKKGIQSLDNAGNLVPINSLDDFVKFGKNMSAANLGKVQSNLLKSTLPIADKAKYIENYVAQNIKKGFGKGLNSTQISDDLFSKGFPKDVADDVANKVTNHYSGIKPITQTTQKVTGTGGVIKKTRRGGKKNLKRKNQKNPTNTTTQQTQQIEAELAKGGKPSWSAWVKWGAGLGISAAALWWFFHDSSEDVPIPDDMPMGEPIDNSPSANSGGGTTYTPCTGTYTQNCKSEKIREVQRCLGMPPKYQTGNFGPITFGYLERQGKGFQNGFTDADVSKICGNTLAGGGGSQNQTQPVSPQVQYGTDTSTPSIVGGISGGDTGTQETEVDINDSII